RELEALMEIHSREHNSIDGWTQGYMEGMRAALSLMRPWIREAFQDGQALERNLPVRRHCQMCDEPVKRNKLFCPKHAAVQRTIQNRLAKRRQREKEAKCQRSQRKKYK